MFGGSLIGRSLPLTCITEALWRRPLSRDVMWLTFPDMASEIRNEVRVAVKVTYFPISSLLKSLRHLPFDFGKLLVAFFHLNPDHTRADIHDEQHREGVTAVFGEAGGGSAGPRYSCREYCKFLLKTSVCQASS